MTSPTKKPSGPTSPSGEPVFEEGLNNILSAYRTRFGRELSPSESTSIVSQARAYFDDKVIHQPNRQQPSREEQRSEQGRRSETQEREWQARQLREQQRSTQIHYRLGSGGQVTREILRISEGSSSSSLQATPNTISRNPQEKRLQENTSNKSEDRSQSSIDIEPTNNDPSLPQYPSTFDQIAHLILSSSSSSNQFEFLQKNSNLSGLKIIPNQIHPDLHLIKPPKLAKIHGAGQKPWQK